LALLLVGGCFAAAASVSGTDASGTQAVDLSRPEKAHVSFGEDGKLTILQVADIQDDAVLSTLIKRSLPLIIKKTQPDLIVLTGDNIGGYSCKTKVLATAAIRQYMDIFEKYGIPVAQVFGNHDDQDTKLTKELQFEVYEQYDCFIGCVGVVAETTVGENTMKNVGTYNIPIYESAESDKVAFNIWMFDSGTYNPDDTVGGYGYVLPEQMDWYVEKSNELKEANGGELVPSIAFQHIVPPQIKYALKEVDKDTEGAVGFAGSYYVLPDDVDRETNWLSEAPCPPNTDFEPGFLQVDTMLEQGDVIGVFFGHDHINAYCVDYQGIDLVSSPGQTYASYNDDHRGYRTITLDLNDLTTYETATYTNLELFEEDPIANFLQKFVSLWDRISNFFENLWDQISG
jgi:hypothetical protein